MDIVRKTLIAKVSGRRRAGASTAYGLPLGERPTRTIRQARDDESHVDAAQISVAEMRFLVRNKTGGVPKELRPFGNE
ncbi:hypothetical protein GCM10022267_45680 [Lentzea roselyniae]|uniref:Uncharacterized protein n=1 Tax=Lentzea roselyniae TaxID=531940 RepID=A0ABP7BCX2_9PSEU